VVLAGVLALLALAVANPDGLIVERNLVRFEQTGRIDTGHLAELSADAVPALDRLPEPYRSCTLWRIQLSEQDDDWRGWSYGRERAWRLLAERATSTTLGVCVPTAGR
jgi:hypothetical protein